MARLRQMFRYDETSQASEVVLIVSAASEQAAAGLARRSVTAAETSCFGSLGVVYSFRNSHLSLVVVPQFAVSNHRSSSRRTKWRKKNQVTSAGQLSFWVSYRTVPGHLGVSYHCHWLMTNVESLGHEAFLKPAET